MLGDVDPARVKVESWTPTVYRGRDNVLVTRFMQYREDLRRDVPLDWSLVSRVILVLPDADPAVAFDSAVAPGSIDWVTHGNGAVEFLISKYALKVGTYRAQVIAFDAEHPDGQVVVSSLATKNEFTITVSEVLAVGSLPAPMPTGGESAVRVAGQVLSALRVVYERNGRVYLLDPSDPFSEDVQFTLGITVTAAQEGENVVVQRSGTIDSAGWNWAEGLVFVGSAGLMTQTPPLVGWELVVGFAPEATRLNIDFDEPVRLAQEVIYG